eukprot:scaffold22908_cov53-Cyclotella_meneghiniana.AAC.3
MAELKRSHIQSVVSNRVAVVGMQRVDKSDEDKKKKKKKKKKSSLGVVGLNNQRCRLLEIAKIIK